jgi:hypothetical protein
MVKRLAGLVTLGMLTLGMALGARATGGKQFWSGASGGYRWIWTEKDITAQPASGGRAFSLKRQIFPKGYGKGELEGMTSFTATAKPLSVVGSLLCIREDHYWEGGAHPSGSISYAAVDIAHPKRKLKLTDFFPDAQVRDALWADKIIHKTLADAGVKRKPATAFALQKALATKYFGGEEGQTYCFTVDFLSQFSFHHLEGNRVAVRLCVPWGAEIYRFQSTEIGILLPVPAALRSQIQAAADGKAGFLARQYAKRFEDQSATLVEVGERG